MTNDPIEEFLVQLETETSITKIVECQQLLALVRIYRETGIKLLEHIERPIQYQEREHAREVARTANQKALAVVNGGVK